MPTGRDGSWATVSCCRSRDGRQRPVTCSHCPFCAASSPRTRLSSAGHRLRCLRPKPRSGPGGNGSRKYPIWGESSYQPWEQSATCPCLHEHRQPPKNGKVAPPRRKRNAEARSREHLTPREVEKLLEAARRSGRYGQRDETLLLITYRHALRVSEGGIAPLGADRPGGWLGARRAPEEWPAVHPSPAGHRAAGAASSAARVARVALRLRV